MSDKKNIVHNQGPAPTIFPSLGTNLTKKKPNIINKTAKPGLNINSNKNKKMPTEEKTHIEDMMDSKPKVVSNDVVDNVVKIKSTFEAHNSSGDEEIEEFGEMDDDSNDNSDVPLITELTLSKKETYHYKIIDKYYKTLNVNDVMTLIDIVEKKSKVSLRLIDWFVTKYSYKHKVRLETNNDPNNVDNGFNVHISYKAQLQSYKKKYFDPFRRRKRLKFKYFFDKEKKISLCTTIGQLNFFKWAFTNNIVAYVINNYETIAKAMTHSNKLDKSKKQGISNSDNGTTSVSDVVSNPETTSPNKKTNGKIVKKPGISKPAARPPNENMSLRF
jgi:hypothetical protein